MCHTCSFLAYAIFGHQIVGMPNTCSKIKEKVRVSFFYVKKLSFPTELLGKRKCKLDWKDKKICLIVKKVTKKRKLKEGIVQPKEVKQDKSNGEIKQDEKKQKKQKLENYFLGNTLILQSAIAIIVSKTKSHYSKYGYHCDARR